MTASTVKSTKVTALMVTDPSTPEPTYRQEGRVVVSSDTIEAATTSLDEAADVILMLPISSSASVSSLVLYNDDLDSGGTSGAVDIGLYNGARAFVDTDSSATAKAAYAALDVDCFASAITTLTAANTLGVQVRFEAGAGSAGDVKDVGKRMWEVAGLTSDPKRNFLVGITVTTQMTTPVAGTITLVAQSQV